MSVDSMQGNHRPKEIEDDRKRKELIQSLKAMDEAAMAQCPKLWPKSESELFEAIRNLTDRPHGYGTAARAMTLCAEAAFNYAASVVGASGFQAGCADIEFLNRKRSYKHGFRIIDYSRFLYPQCDREGERIAVDEGSLSGLQQAAQALIAEREEKNQWVSPDVWKRWQLLAGGGVPDCLLAVNDG